MIKTVKVLVKVVDPCTTTLYDENHQPIISYDGDVFVVPGLCGYGYVSATIDNESGKIIGWRPISEEKLERIRKVIKESS